MHDSRCEADWNDGECACRERSENQTFPAAYPARPNASIWKQLLTTRRRRS